VTTAKSPTPFGALLQGFFSGRLIEQRDVSPKTVASYRDTFRLLLRYIEREGRGCPSDLTLESLDAHLVVDFLNHLEHERGNSIRTRNARLAAIRSFFQYAAFEAPQSLNAINRVLSIPMKRFVRPSVRYLSRPEIDALLAAPDRNTWTGRRDHAMFTTLYNTGARVSELTAIRLADVSMAQHPGWVSLHGKGRKERTVPLWKSTSRLLKHWIRELPERGEHPLFPNAGGTTLSRSAVELRLKRATAFASSTCPSLQGKTVSPHMIRHTTAMHLLNSGIDLSVIALWLGHESIQTTHTYLETDLATKERALSRVEPVSSSRKRFAAKDSLIDFLENL
jgi:integrase/recombinase XerD